MKKLFSLILVLALTLSLGITPLADETGIIYSQGFIGEFLSFTAAYETITEHGTAYSIDIFYDDLSFKYILNRTYVWNTDTLSYDISDNPHADAVYADSPVQQTDGKSYWESTKAIKVVNRSSAKVQVTMQATMSIDYAGKLDFKLYEVSGSEPQVGDNPEISKILTAPTSSQSSDTDILDGKLAICGQPDEDLPANTQIGALGIRFSAVNENGGT